METHLLHPLYRPTLTPISRKNDQMLNLRKSKEAMGRSKPDGKCKKHPKHRQSPGVCPLCLAERLSQLSSSRSRKTSTTAGSFYSSSPSSLSSYYSSSSASSCSSPLPPFRFSKEGKSSISFLLSGKNVLTKSRSLAFAPRTKSGDDDGKKKKGGFLSKLLRPRRKRMEDTLTQSMSTRERVTI